MNQITLDTEAQSNGWALGPNVGVRFDAKVGRVQLEGVISHRWMWGPFRTSNRFRDVDRISIDYEPYGTVDKRIILDGDIPFEETVAASIPVTELRLAARLPLGGFRLGVGTFLQRYQNVPMSPELSYRDLTFKSRYQDLALGDIGVHVSAAF